MNEHTTRPGTGCLTRQRLVAGLLTFVVFLSATGCSEDPVPGLLAQAELAVRSGDPRAAVVYYGTAAAKAPQDDFIRWQLAKLLLIVRDGAAAEKEIRAAAALGVGNDRVAPALAQALFLQHKYRQVIQLPIDGLGKTPAAIVTAYQSRAQLELNDVEAAEGLLIKATKLSRYTADVVFAEAELALYRKDLQAAREALHNVRLLEPEFPYAAARLGEIALLEDDAESAERYLDEAVELRFGPWRDRLNLGIARLRQGKIDQALEDAEALLASLPMHSEVQLFAYQTYALKGEQQKARTALEQVLAREPDNAEALYALARIEVAAGRHEHGESITRNALALRPELSPARELLALLLLEQDRTDEVLDLILPALEAPPGTEVLLRIAAGSLIKAGRYDDFAALAGRLENALPEEQRPTFRDGISQLQGGDAETALGLIQPLVAMQVQDLPSANPLEVHLVAGTARGAATARLADTGDLSRPPPAEDAEPSLSAPAKMAEAVMPQQGPTPMPSTQEAQAAAPGEQPQSPGAAQDDAQPTAALIAAQAELAALQQAAEALESEARVLQSMKASLREGDARPTPGTNEQPEDAPPAMAMAQAPDEAGPASAPPVQADIDRRDKESPPQAGAPVDGQTPADTQDSSGTIENAGVLPVAPPIDEVTTEEVARTHAAVEAFVRDWAAAWSRQDVDDYLSRYATDYLPADGASRAAWAEQRRERLRRPKSIQVEVDELEVTALDADRARATFEQRYRANHYQDQVTKTLDLTLEDGAWKIQREVGN